MKCSCCAGDGWYLDHSDAHHKAPASEAENCEKYGCPVQRQCEKCKGTGEV
jgi:DnaJ-class molecular chaperone